MAMDELNSYMMDCFNDAGVPCYWSGLCLWFGLPESDRFFVPAGARWSRKRGMWYRKNGGAY